MRTAPEITMKILFLTKYPAAGASSRYRVYQYLPYLRRYGVECDVSPFYSQKAYPLLYARGRLPQKIVAVLAGLLRRLRDARRIKKYDLVFCQREAVPFGPLWFEKKVKKAGVPLVFDYDDALFIFKPSSRTPLADKLKNPHRIPRIMAQCQTVFAGNDYLREQARPFCADSRTVWVAEDTQRWARRPPHRDKTDIVVGWLGSPSTEKYLEIIRPALSALAAGLKQHGKTLHLLVVGGGAFQSNDFSVEHRQWSLDSEIESVHRFDIGVMPLPDEEWSEGKSGGKARTYMAAGVPAVVADVGFNRQLIQPGQTGFLCRQQDDWLDTLLPLALDAPLRERIAQQARLAVEEKHSLSALAPVFLQQLSDVVARHGGRERRGPTKQAYSGESR